MPTYSWRGRRYNASKPPNVRYSNTRKAKTRRTAKASRKQRPARRMVSSTRVKKSSYRKNTKYVNPSIGHDSTSNLTVYEKTRYGRIPYKEYHLYKSAMKNIMTDERVYRFEGGYQIANISNTAYGQCTWYCLEPLSAGILDILIADSASVATSNLATSSRKTFLDKVLYKIKAHNAFSQKVQLDIWKCTPRRDVSAGVGVISGINPQLFQTGVTNNSTPYAGGPPSTAIAYNRYTATPFLSDVWCNLFKMSRFPVKSCILEPGQMFNMNINITVGKAICKRQFDAGDSDTIATYWQHPRICGSVYLIRVRGTPVHFESPTSVNLPIVSGDAPVTMGGYAVDFTTQQAIYCRVANVAGEHTVQYYGTPFTGVLGATAGLATGFNNSAQWNQDGSNELRGQY